MKNKYDQFEKRIAVLDTRIEILKIAVVADNPHYIAVVADKPILEKGTLLFH